MVIDDRVLSPPVVDRLSRHSQILSDRCHRPTSGDQVEHPATKLRWTLPWHVRPSFTGQSTPDSNMPTPPNRGNITWFIEPRPRRTGHGWPRQVVVPDVACRGHRQASLASRWGTSGTANVGGVGPAEVPESRQRSAHQCAAIRWGAAIAGGNRTGCSHTQPNRDGELTEQRPLKMRP